MMKRTVRKLELNKESIRQLDPQDMKEAAGGATALCTTSICSKFCTDGSCGHICP